MNAHRPIIPGAREKFAHVDVWVFDLDNTLYPHGSEVWPQIDARITLYVANLLGIDSASARSLQKYYYEHYGTTLKGLMIDHAVQPEGFLDFVHTIDRSSLAPNPALAKAIAALPGRKLILTSGSREHAMRTAERLGIEKLFEDVFDIAASDFVPKPEAETFERFFAKHGVDPARAAMFEDLQKNLAVPHARGMVTILVVPGAQAAGPALPHVDFVTDDIAEFLTGVAPLAASPI